MGQDRESVLTFGSILDLGPRLGAQASMVVTDAMIEKLHGSDFPQGPRVLVERGEAAKSLAGLEGLWQAFLAAGLDRGSLVLAIGGGSVSDLAGFAASTWLRGIDFGFCPTTLLSMVDASVGGKNGIDFGGLKNLVGTFSKPRFVHFDVSLLDSLPDRDFASGMAEVIKHGVLEGGEHFAFLEKSCVSRHAMTRPVVEDVVRRSVAYKAGVTARDPKEAGERRLLNLGHTIGHGIEAVTGLPHGHCVAAGLGCALELAQKSPKAKPEARDRVLALLKAWGLPASLTEAAALAESLGKPAMEPEAFRQAVIAAVASDKKRDRDEVRFILPYDLGAVAVETLALRDLDSFIREAE